MNRLYRRTLLGGLGAWASSASARDARDGQPVEPDPVVRVGNVPFRLEGGVVLDISVNGGAPAPFVLDTMSVGTHLDVGFAAGLGLDAADAQTIQAVASGQATSGQIGRVTLRAAGIILPTQYVGVQVLPNRMVDRGRRPRLAGIIGLGVWARRSCG